jgi:hypothetical protein
VQHTLDSKKRMPQLSLSLNKLVLLTCLLVSMYFGYEKYVADEKEQKESSVFILTPKVNDIYFLDLRLLKGKSARLYQLESKHKYTLAKVVRVSDDNVAIVYGRFFYQWQYSMVSSIEYGDLSNKNYFSLLPEYIPFSKIKKMKSNGAIYLVKRPILNKLYGNFVSP